MVASSLLSSSARCKSARSASRLRASRGRLRARARQRLRHRLLARAAPVRLQLGGADALHQVVVRLARVVSLALRARATRSSSASTSFALPSAASRAKRASRSSSTHRLPSDTLCASRRRSDAGTEDPSAPSADATLSEEAFTPSPAACSFAAHRTASSSSRSRDS